MIKIVPNVQYLLNRVNLMMKHDSCLILNLILDIKPNYENVVNMWNYFKSISETYHSKYSKVDINGSEDIISEYKRYFNRYPIIKDVFESHTKINSDHLILFYIKDCDFVFILFKNTRSKLVFNQIKLDASMFDDNSMKKIGGNLDNNQIRMIFFSE